MSQFSHKFGLNKQVIWIGDLKMLDWNITSTVAEMELQSRLKYPLSVASSSGTVDDSSTGSVVFKSVEEPVLTVITWSCKCGMYNARWALSILHISMMHFITFLDHNTSYHNLLLHTCNFSFFSLSSLAEISLFWLSKNTIREELMWDLVLKWLQHWPCISGKTLHKLTLFPVSQREPQNIPLLFVAQKQPTEFMTPREDRSHSPSSTQTHTNTFLLWNADCNTKVKAW